MWDFDNLTLGTIAWDTELAPIHFPTDQKRNKLINQESSGLGTNIRDISKSRCYLVQDLTFRLFGPEAQEKQNSSAQTKSLAL